jgi:hypothetical protein
MPVDDPRHSVVPGACLDVGLKLDRRDDRLMVSVNDVREDVEDSSARFGFLAIEESPNRLALRRVRLLINDQDGLAPPFVDGAGHADNPAKVKSSSEAALPAPIAVRRITRGCFLRRGGQALHAQIAEYMPDNVFAYLEWRLDTDRSIYD